MAEVTPKPYEMLRPAGGPAPAAGPSKTGETGFLRKADAFIIEMVRRYSLPVLRIFLGVVFIWFGALKIFDASPVADVVARTLSFLPARTAVLATGITEVVIGLGLVTRLALRLTLLLFFFQMLGTFVSAIRFPSVAFRGGNPLLLTDYGEFLVKNLILISAGLVILGTVPKEKESDS